MFIKKPAVDTAGRLSLNMNCYMKNGEVVGLFL